MDLRQNIEKATLLNWRDEDAKFFPLQGLSQAARDRMMNERKVKKPRNIHLVEDLDKDNDKCIDYIMKSKVKPTFDKHAVSAAIREVNGGRDLSNKHWEESWFKTLENITNVEKETSQTSEHEDTEAYFENQLETKSLNDKYIKQKHKLLKNAAIMGLITTKKISLQDLISPHNENSTREENKLAETASGYITDDDKYEVESIPLREDPEIFVHPLQMGINKKNFKDTDFTLPRIGKKTKVTPQEYFLETTNDDCFNFVKKKDTISKIQ